MGKVTEISFDVPGTPADDEVMEHAPVDVSGWFDGYGDMLTVDDLAQILHVSRKTVQNRCRAGDLPAVAIGRRWYVPKSRLVAFIVSGCGAVG